ncbi:MAG: hypothetical protein ABIJ45_05010 [Candidatus Zixiibacteriota bacterium]
MDNFKIDSQNPRAYFQSMWKLWLIIVLSVLNPALSFSESEPFTILGFEIPSIENEDWLLSTDRIPIYSIPITVEMLFFISSEGMIDSIQFIPEDRSKYVKNITESLNNIKFYPARYQGCPIPFIVPARIYFINRYGRSTMNLELPFQEPSCDKRKEYLKECLEINGIHLPSVEEFPPYFLGITGFEENLNYPAAVYEIELDSSGRVEEFDQVLNFGDDYSKTIDNAILYAKFAPASYNGEPFESKFYLIVRYFKTIEYPTEVWSSENDITNYRLKKFRLERLLYLDSIINPALPLNVPMGILKSGTLIPFRDSLEVEITIDTKGKIKRSYPLGQTNSYLINEYKNILEKLYFLPARDINDKIIEYTGRIKMIFNNSNQIKVYFGWIPLKINEEILN